MSKTSSHGDKTRLPYTSISAIICSNDSLATITAVFSVVFRCVANIPSPCRGFAPSFAMMLVLSLERMSRKIEVTPSISAFFLRCHERVHESGKLVGIGSIGKVLLHKPSAVGPIYRRLPQTICYGLWANRQEKYPRNQG